MSFRNYVHLWKLCKKFNKYLEDLGSFVKNQNYRHVGD